MRLPAKRAFNKRRIGSAAAILAVGVVLSWTTGWWPSVAAAQETAQKQSHPGAALPMSEKYFKNVKALTGVTVDDFMGAMGLYSAALSMCCGDCHVGAGTDNPDWASDANPRKRMARQMETMVRAINKEHFGGGKAITCWTCHRGSGSPSVTATMDQIYGDPLSFPSEVVKQAPSTSGVPTIDQIFDKYEQALGGADKVAGLTSYIATAATSSYGPVDRTDPAEIYAKAPGQFTMLVHQRGGDMARTTDGSRAWVKLPLTVVKEYPLTGSLLEGGKADGLMAFPGLIRKAYSNWRVGFPTSIGDKPVWQVQASGASGLLVTLYFDKETGLLVRYVRHVNTADGRMPTEIDYSDYRPVAGVMMPYQFTYNWISGREGYTISEYKPNVEVEAAKFAEPELVAK